MRKDWDRYFLDIAKMVATRSTCDRKYVGCVLVRDRTILSTGYNGAIRGMPDCSEVGHDIEGGHCVRASHSETNALILAARNGTSVEGCEAYVTALPCWNCFKHLVNAGVKKIYYIEAYRPNPRIAEAVQTLGIELIQLADENGNEG